MYNSIIVENFSDPKNVGNIEDPDMEIKVGNEVCDDQLIIHLNLTEDDIISRVKYRAYGCATSIATGNIFCDFALGKSLHLIGETPKYQRHEMLGELDPSQHHCLDILNNIFAHFETLPEVNHD